MTLAALAAGSSTALAVGALGVGSKAPPIKVAKWIKGKPVTKFEKGKVYVVEFWATWCGPCKQSIPHITSLAKKYKGKATFTGVSVWEEEKKSQAKLNTLVAAFVKDFGDKMDYNVAVDDVKGTMAQTWMAAAQQNGIPTAFVIDQTGKIAWIGHPMGDLDRVVGQVIAKKFDVKAEARRAELERQEQMKEMQLIQPVGQLLREQKFSEAVAALDKAFAQSPKLETSYGIQKYVALAQYDAAAANAYAAKLADGLYASDANMLNGLAWTMVDERTGIKGADYALSVRVAQKGVALLKPSDTAMSAFLLDTLAFAQYKNGDVSSALRNQELALKAADATKDFDPATKKEMLDRLALYKKG